MNAAVFVFPKRCRSESATRRKRKEKAPYYPIVGCYGSTVPDYSNTSEAPIIQYLYGRVDDIEFSAIVLCLSLGHALPLSAGAPSGLLIISLLHIIGKDNLLSLPINARGAFRGLERSSTSVQGMGDGLQGGAIPCAGGSESFFRAVRDPGGRGRRQVRPFSITAAAAGVSCWRLG